MGMISLDDSALAILDEVKEELLKKGIKADNSEAVRYMRAAIKKI